MPKKLPITITLLILATLTFAQTTNRGIVAETIAESESTLGKPEIKFQTGHSAPVNSVCFSPDGKYIASGDDSGIVKLWETETFKEIRSFDIYYEASIYSIDFSPDGKYITCSACNVLSTDYQPDEPTKIIDIITGTEIVKFSKTGVGSDFSPDGKYIAIGSNDGTVKLWEVESGKEIRTFSGHTDDVRSVSFSPDGKYIASGSYDGIIKLWVVESGKEIRTFEGHTRYVASVSFSPDGKYVASASDDDTVKLWEVESGKELRSFKGHAWYGNSVSFSLDGKYIASAEEDTIKLREVESGKEIRTFEGHMNVVNSVSFSPDGKYIVSGDYNGTLRIWDVERGKEVRTSFSVVSSVYSVRFSPDGEYLFCVGADNKIRIWDAANGKELRIFTGYTECKHSVSFSPDGKYLASGSNDGTVKLWEVESGKEIMTFSGHTAGVISVSFSPDGKYIASGSDDDTVKLWDMESGKEVKTFSGHSLGVNTVSFCPDGKYVASDSGLYEIKLWEVESGKEIEIESDVFWGRIGSFRSDGKYLSMMKTGGHSLDLIDVDTGKVIDLEDVLETYEYSADFSPSGKYVASSGYYGEIKLWDIESSKLVKLINGHTDSILSINFSSDSKYIASGSADGTVKLWDVETGELIYTIINGKDGEWLTYTPEGFFTGSEWAIKNLVHIVDGLEVIGIDQVYDKLYRPDLVAAKIRGEDISMYAKEVNLASLVRSGSVPVVTLKNIPENPTSRDITFNVCVKNTGGGIGKVNLVLNGKTIQLSEGIESSIGQTVNFEHTITLQNGENSIEAFAYNGSGLVESRRPSSTISWEGKTTKPNLYVLTLAINKYRDKSLWLKYCVSDANAIAESFKSQESGLYENVYVSSLQDEEVTKDGISEEFKRLSNLVTADDVFVFYISGHGTTYDDLDYYYIPVNFRYTSREEIPIQGVSKNDLIENLSLIKAGKTLLMLDTCNSGAFVADLGERGFREKEAIDRLTKATGHATLAASSESKPAMEGYEGHGVFTYVLLEGLDGEADSNNDGFVTILELASYVEKEVPKRSYEKWGHEQVPQKDLRRQDFPIAGK